MQRDFWLEAWAAGRTGFHSDAIHPTLLSHADAFLGDVPRRVLVPLCGKSLDLLWLRDRGHEVVGVEFAPAALDAFCETHGLTPERIDHAHGFTLRSPGLTLVCADYFEVTTELVGTIDRVWDRASLVAIDPARREEYVAVVRRLLAPGGVTLLEAFEYDQDVMQGPPWSVPRARVEALYADFDPTLLKEEDATDRIGFKGHERFLVHAWRLVAPA